jgi:hypothetical protein
MVSLLHAASTSLQVDDSSGLAGGKTTWTYGPTDAQESFEL